MTLIMLLERGRGSPPAPQRVPGDAKAYKERQYEGCMYTKRGDSGGFQVFGSPNAPKCSFVTGQSH